MEDREAPQADPKAALQQIFGLLKARDDTSRFVGLSLLRSLLDANESLRDDEETVLSCWESIPNKFLLKLMNVGQSRSMPLEEKKNMQNLAVAVVHTFANLLPAKQLESNKILEFCEPLVRLIPKLDAAPQMLAFQALQCIASSIKDVHVIEEIFTGGLDEIRDAGIGDARYLKEYLKLYSILWSTYGGSEVRKEIAVTLSNAEKTDQSSVLECLADLAEELTFLGDAEFVEYAYRLIQITLMARPTAKARTSAVKLASAILQRMPQDSVYTTSLFAGSNLSSQPEGKPFAYIFIQYVLIDLRSTIPSLMSNLASPIYTTDSLRLAACYDIISAFTFYLMRGDPDIASEFNPELLLKLRRDLSETFSLTLEFIRDRWDALISGASGLHPGARTDLKAAPMLTWDNPSIPPEEDPIVVSGLRAIATWIREDENSDLHAQAVDVIDILAALYFSSMAKDARADLRHPILVFLEGLLPNAEEAVQRFLDQDGCNILAQDLYDCLRPFYLSTEGVVPPFVQDIIRVMMIIIESDTVPQTREKWMSVVKWVAEIPVPRELLHVDTLADLYQLAGAIVLKAPRRLQDLVRSDVKRICEKGMIMAERTGIDEDTRMSFLEVLDVLQDLS